MLSRVFVAICIMVFAASTASSQVVIVGTRFGGQIGGLNFSSGDLVRYNMDTGEAEIYLPESTFDNFVGSVSGPVPINLDAFSLVPGSIESFVFSARVGVVVNAQTVTRNGVTVATNGGTVVSQRELILSDGVETNNIEEIFDVLSTDLSAVAYLPNGNLLLAAKTDRSFRNLLDLGVDYRVGDVVEYNLETGVGSIFFSTDNFFTPDEGGQHAVGSIDALEYLPNGNLLLSTTNNAQIGTNPDALTLRQGGMYEYNFSTGEVSTFLDPDVFDSSAVDLKAFSIVSFKIGDVDRNGVIEFLDIGPFVDVLITGGFQLEADIDSNGVVDFLDVGPFVDLLLQQ